MSHSFSTLSQYVPFRVDFVYITFLLRKGNSFYAIMMLGPPIRLNVHWNIQRRKLIISGSSKGVTVNSCHSFCISRVAGHMLIWPYKYLLFDGSGSGQGSRTQMDSNSHIIICLVHQFACLESLSCS